MKTTRTLAAPEADPSIALAMQILRECAELERLLGTWGDEEAFLATHYDWFGLDATARKRLPSADVFHTIEHRLRHLVSTRSARLRRLNRVASVTPHGMISKLRVVQASIEAEENQGALRLLSSAIDELDTWFQQYET